LVRLINILVRLARGSQPNEWNANVVSGAVLAVGVDMGSLRVPNSIAKQPELSLCRKCCAGSDGPNHFLNANESTAQWLNGAGYFSIPFTYDWLRRHKMYRE
jgi:hypothetical protein